MGLQKTKILYVSHSPYINGAEHCLYTLIKYLDQSAFEPAVIFPASGPLKEMIEALGIRTYICPIERWVRYDTEICSNDYDIFSRIDAFLQVFDLEKPDVVHTNTSVVCEGALAAYIRGIPHVWHIHEDLVTHPRLRPVIPLPLVYWGIEQLSNKIVVVSESVKRQLPNGRLPESKICTIYNGIDEKMFSTSISAMKSIRDELGFCENDIVAVSIGALIKEKGHDVLLDAAVLASKNNKNLKFIIAGSGTPESKQDLICTVEKLGLKDTVFYIGFRHDMPTILSDSDVLILSSYSEAFPLAILEAMASGKPVIATDCGGPSEMVIDGETGYIVPVGDHVALASKTLEVIADKAVMREMGAKAHARFSANFRAEVNAEHFEALYKDVVAKCFMEKCGTNDLKILDAFLHVYQSMAKQFCWNGEESPDLSSHAQHVNDLPGNHGQENECHLQGSFFPTLNRFFNIFRR